MNLINSLITHIFQNNLISNLKKILILHSFPKIKHESNIF